MPKYKLLGTYDAGGDLSKEWYVEYYYLKPDYLQQPDDDPYQRFRIRKTINCEHTSSARRKRLKIVFKTMQQLLEDGFNPFSRYIESDNSVQYPGYNITRCIEEYLKLVKPDLRDGTYRKYEERLNFFKDWLIGKNMNHYMIYHITRNHVFEFLKEHQQIDGEIPKHKVKKWSNKTYNHYLQALSTFFNYFIDNREDYIEKNPCDKIKRLQVIKKGNRPLDNHDFPAALEWAKDNDPYLYQFERFIYYTCFRPDSELRLLQIHEIDLVSRKIMVPGQNAKSKTTAWIPIDDALFQILYEMELHKYPRTFYLFGKKGEPGPDPVHEKYFNKKFRKCKTENNFHDEVTLYGFKHTRAIHLVEDGEKLTSIIKLTRHKTLAELMDYLKDMGVIIGEEINLKSRRI